LAGLVDLWEEVQASGAVQTLILAYEELVELMRGRKGKVLRLRYCGERLLSPEEVAVEVGVAESAVYEAEKAGFEELLKQIQMKNILRDFVLKHKELLEGMEERKEKVLRVRYLREKLLSYTEVGVELGIRGQGVRVIECSALLELWKRSEQQRKIREFVVSHKDLVNDMKGLSRKVLRLRYLGRRVLSAKKVARQLKEYLSVIHKAEREGLLRLLDKVGYVFNEEDEPCENKDGTDLEESL